jgi:hypothetical protein
MSNLTDFFGKATTRAAGTSPHSQPAFVVKGGYSTSYHQMLVYSHDMQCVGNYKSNNDNTSDHSNNFVDANFWNYATNIGSNEVYGNGQGFSTSGYLGNHAIDQQIQSGERRSAAMHRRDTIRASTNMVGTNPGIKQNYAIATSFQLAGTSAWIKSCPRSVRSVYTLGNSSPLGNQVSRVEDTVYVADVGMMTTNYRLASGGFSYNQNSGNAVIIERENSSTTTPWRPVLIKNFPNPGAYVSDQHEWGEAISAVTAVSANRVVGPDDALTTGTGASYSSRLEEGYKHVKAVLCDNNDVVVMHHYQSGVAVHRWRWNESNNQWDTPVCRTDAYSSIYIGQPRYPGVNWSMTLDGKTVVLQRQTAYVGAGFYGCFIDVATGNIKLLAHKETSFGWSIVPIGASGFLITRSANTDSAGVEVAHIRWDGIFGNPAGDYFTSGPSASSAFNSYTAAFTISGQYYLDAPSHSTNYPAIYPINQVDNEAIVMAEKGAL